MKNKYGFLGFLSIIGLAGLLTKQWGLLPYLGFAVFFQYFAVTPDEMFTAYMNRSAARAFLSGMVVTAAVMLACVAGVSPQRASAAGFAAGWGVSVLVFSLSAAYYELKEHWGARHAENQD